MDRILSREDAEPLKNQKSPPAGAEELGFGTSRGRASTLPATIHAVGPEHSTDADVDLSAHDAGDTKPQVDFQWFECTGSMLVEGGPLPRLRGRLQELADIAGEDHVAVLAERPDAAHEIAHRLARANLLRVVGR